MPGFPKLSLVEGTFEELAQELATYLDTLKGDGSNVASEVSALLADPETPDRPQQTNKDAVLKKLVTASSVLNGAPERELQAAYNLLIHLISLSEDPDTYLPPVCKYLTSPITSSPQNGTGIALGILATLFNAVEPDDETRYHVLLAIVDLVKKSSNFNTIESQLRDVDNWIQQWELEPEQSRKLYIALSEAASAANEPEESYAYLLKGLRTVQSSPSSPEARELSLNALTVALQDEKHFDFQDLIALDSVQALRKSDSTWSELLELFSSSDYEDYQEFDESNPTFFSDNKLDDAILTRKIRLLTLASLAAHETQTRTLAYARIAKALNIPSEDVEVWVIDSIRSGLVEGKLSQQKQEFLIHRSTYRTFGENQWREVASRLETWKSSLINVLEVIRAQKAEFIKEKEAELAAPEPRSNYRQDRRQRNQPSAIDLD